MSWDFNADEVFEMAEQIERNGVAFYKRAAEGIDDADSRKMLLELADMEVDHEKTFAGIRAGLTDQDKQGVTFDPNQETALYLKALADTRVFFEKEIDVTSMKEILKAAIQAEKDSIVFYLGMKEAVPEDLGKNKLDAIIKEEMGHISLLAGKLSKLK